MSNEGRDEVELIRELADRLAMPSHDSINRNDLESADEFVARMKREGIEPGHARVARFGHSRKTRVVLLGVAAASAVFLAVVGLANPWTGRSAYAGTPPMLTYGFADSGKVAYAPGRPAGQALRKLAKLAKTAPDASNRTNGTQLVVTSGWYARLDSQASKDSAQVVPTMRETRLLPNGAVLLEERRGMPLTADGRGIRDATKGTTKIERIPRGTFETSRATDLGTDPNSVRESSLKRTDCQTEDVATTTACLFREIITLNEHWVVSPALRSAFWTVLADQPGVRCLGDVTDRAGRAGIGFAIDSTDTPALRTILIISRQDGRLLGVEEVLTRDDADTKVEAPAVYAFTAILKSEWQAPGSTGG